MFSISPRASLFHSYALSRIRYNGGWVRDRAESLGRNFISIFLNSIISEFARTWAWQVRKPSPIEYTPSEAWCKRKGISPYWSDSDWACGNFPIWVAFLIIIYWTTLTWHNKLISKSRMESARFHSPYKNVITGPRPFTDQNFIFHFSIKARSPNPFLHLREETLLWWTRLVR